MIIEHKPRSVIRQCCATFHSQTRFLPVVVVVIVVVVIIVVGCCDPIVAACNKILTFTLKKFQLEF